MSAEQYFLDQLVKTDTELYKSKKYIKTLEESIINTTAQMNIISAYLTTDSAIISEAFLKAQEENKKLIKRNEELLDHLVQVCKFVELKINLSTKN